jgi:glycosyltransferase involved in cell wall biosynthesis
MLQVVTAVERAQRRFDASIATTIDRRHAGSWLDCACTTHKLSYFGDISWNCGMANRCGHRSVSIIIPAFNSASLLPRAIESILDQEYPSSEIIVVDDGSTDSTRIACLDYPTVKYIHQSNSGACKARDTGLAHATSEFCIFLDADDYFVGDYLHKIMEIADDDADLLIGCQIEELRDRSCLPRKDYRHVCNMRQLVAEYLENPLQTATLTWRRSIFDPTDSGWKPGLKITQDTYFFYRNIFNVRRFACLSDCDAYLFWSSDNSGGRISANTTLAKRKDIIKVLDSIYNTICKHSDGDPDARSRWLVALAKRYYQTSILFFHAGDAVNAKYCLTQARKLGLRNHIGGAAHKFLSNVLGLEVKTRLSSGYHRRFSRKPTWMRPYPYCVEVRD